MQKALITAVLGGMIAAATLSSSYAAGNGRAATGVAAPGTTTGIGNGGVSTGAGSASTGANSVANPSGNSLINTSPSGSTLMPNTGGSAGGGRRR